MHSTTAVYKLCIEIPVSNSANRSNTALISAQIPFKSSIAQMYYTNILITRQLTASSLITAITTSTNYSIAPDGEGNTLTIVAAELARSTSCMGNHY